MTETLTASGPVRGTSNDGVLEFRGIPYAQARRFAAPRPPEVWSEPLDATHFGPIAPQAPGAQFQGPDLAQDEDCLSLNVWTPSVDEPRRPVLVWIHGGAFRSGSGASPLYDGRALAGRGDVVVITINYRLGALGFASHPALAGDDGSCGNWGLLDQIESLRWVRDNAAAFGGDPGNVTIFGESAGAASVWLLCASPLARGLFHKAIAQSGAPVAVSNASAARTAERLAEAVGVADVAALRDVDVVAILAGQTALDDGQMRTFVPTIDGLVLQDRPNTALAAGANSGIPMIVGTNVDEWKLWAPADPHSRDLDEAGLQRRVDRVLPGAADEVIALYRDARTARHEPDAPNELWFAIESDRFFRVPAIRSVEAQIAAGPAPFVYLFGWRSPALGGWLGACHGLEIAFAFGNQGRGELAAFTGSGPDADRLSTTIMDAWLAFARTGNPSTPATPWPAYDAGRRPTLMLDATSGMEDAPREPERAIVDRVLAHS